MSEMPVPAWAEEARKQMFEAHGAVDYSQSGVEVRETNKVLDFSTLFAEYVERDDTILVHVFPRGGEEDRYYPGEVKDEKRIPGRLELSIESIQFPENIRELLEDAASDTWMGDVAIEAVKTLRYDEKSDVEKEEPEEVATGAWVVQFQNVKNTAHIVGVKKFVDKFCEAVDQRLEG